MTRHLETRPGAYFDSVTLMAVSRQVAASEGVNSALVAMATELNLGLLADLGFEPSADLGANDLVIAVDAQSDEALEAALDEAAAALAAGGETGETSGFGEPPSPRTVASATRSGDYGLALISVPGEHAFVEAMDALRAGLHVMVFSDNVTLDQEVALKTEAARRGLLVMGPDCGTAIVGGLGLGFANVTRPGSVGIVAASGTGAQQLCCLLDGSGIGISHVLGVGGRDLSAEVGAASTLQALAALDADPATEAIVVVSKPADDQVAERVGEAARSCTTPVMLAIVGRGRPDLTAAAAEVVALVGARWTEPDWWPAPVERNGAYNRLCGLFAGGTLCDEAMVIAAEALGPISSNIPLEPAWALGDDLTADDHVAIDFGDDRLTRGRPHPMIDQTPRLERIAAAPDHAVLLLDVVTGHGAHPDPAAELAPAIAEAGRSRRDLATVVSLCATRDDPQSLEQQAAALVDAGASVHRSNARAARKAVELIKGKP